MALLDQIRAARETWITANGFDFLVRRPSDYHFAKMRGGKDPGIEILRDCIVGWRNIPGNVIAPGLDGSTPPFEVEAFLEWVTDQPEVMIELLGAVNESVEKRWSARAEAEKK